MVLSIVVLIAIFYGAYLLISVADDLGYTGPSYEKLIVKVFHSKSWVLFAQIMMVLLQIFKVVGHNLFIVKVIEFFLCHLELTKYCVPRPYYVLVSFLLSAPTYLVMNISFYSYISALSVITVNALMIALYWSSGH